MMRIVLIFVLLLGAFFVATTVTRALRLTWHDHTPSESPMPKPFRLISFVLLFVLMLGVSTGWLGAA